MKKLFLLLTLGALLICFAAIASPTKTATTLSVGLATLGVFPSLNRAADAGEPQSGAFVPSGFERADIQKPTACRMVLYFASDNDNAANGGLPLNGAESVPAVVVQSWGSLCCNLTVFEALGGTRFAPSTQHRSTAQPGEAFWDYPPRV